MNIRHICVSWYFTERANPTVFKVTLVLWELLFRKSVCDFNKCQLLQRVICFYLTNNHSERTKSLQLASQFRQKNIPSWNRITAVYSRDNRQFPVVSAIPQVLGPTSAWVSAYINSVEKNCCWSYSSLPKYCISEVDRCQ